MTGPRPGTRPDRAATRPAGRSRDRPRRARGSTISPSPIAAAGTVDVERRRRTRDARSRQRRNLVAARRAMLEGRRRSCAVAGTVSTRRDHRKSTDDRASDRRSEAEAEADRGDAAVAPADIGALHPGRGEIGHGDASDRNLQVAPSGTVPIKPLRAGPGATRKSPGGMRKSGRPDRAGTMLRPASTGATRARTADLRLGGGGRQDERNRQRSAQATHDRHSKFPVVPLLPG